MLYTNTEKFKGFCNNSIPCKNYGRFRFKTYNPIKPDKHKFNMYLKLMLKKLKYFILKIL